MPSAVIDTPSPMERFRIIRILAESADATDYLATDTRLDRPVVLKKLAAIAPGALARGTWLAAARRAGTLAHANIIPLFDAGEDAGRPCLVFEFVEGQTLQELLAHRGPMAVDHAIGICVALCRGVAHAHEHAVLHSDIRSAR